MRHGDHNEQMYVTAGRLCADGGLMYRDFAFVQMPYIPLIYGEMFWLFGDAGYLLLARFFNWAAWCVGAAFIYAIARKVGHSPTIACAFAVLYLVNPTMLRITHEASNYALPATLSLGQMFLVAGEQAGASSRRVFIRAALVGLVGGLAVGIKLYYLPVVAPFILLAGFVPRAGVNVAAFASAVAGFGFALLPVAVLNSQFHYHFMFNNLEFHRLTTAAYRRLGTGAPMGLLQKANYVRTSLLTNCAACFNLLFIAWGGAWLMRRSPGDSGALVHLFATVLCSAGLGLSVALFMTPCWPQYLALAMPYILVAAMLALRFVPEELTQTRTVLVAIGTVLAFAAFVNPKDIVAIFRPQTDWQPLVLKSTAREIERVVKKSAATGKLATVQPLYAIEAGLPIYAEFATGPFVFSVADMLPDDKQKQLLAVGRKRLESVLDADPPAAILAGFYEGDPMFNDQSLISYAEQRNYRRVTLSCCPQLSLYLRPEK